MSLLTGRHPYRNEVWINEHPLASDVPTFAHALAAEGYETVLGGRMHFMGPDQRHGFMQRLTGDICRCYGGGPQTDYGPHKGSASNLKNALDPSNIGPGYNPVIEYDEMVTNDAVEFLQQYSNDKPLCMVVGWYGPHHPFICSQEDYEWVESRMPEDYEPLPTNDTVTSKEKPEGITPQQVRRARVNYAGMICALDRYIGRIVDAASNLTGDTIVIYSSDHGEMAGDQGFWGKCTFYAGSVNVPMVFANLKKSENNETPNIALGEVIDSPASLLDIAPTLVDIVQGERMPVVDGDSLLPVLINPSKAESWKNRPIFSELEKLYDPPIRMVRRGNYKYVYFHNEQNDLLFNLESDPGELHNLANDPDHSALRNELRALARKSWDPDDVYKKQLARMADLKYMVPRANNFGLGKLDLWDQPTPLWEKK